MSGSERVTLPCR